MIAVDETVILLPCTPPPYTFSRWFNRDGEGMLAKWAAVAGHYPATSMIVAGSYSSAAATPPLGGRCAGSARACSSGPPSTAGGRPLQSASAAANPDAPAQCVVLGVRE